MRGEVNEDKTDKLRDLLREALEQVEEPTSADRLAAAIERLAKAIEDRPYWWYQYPGQTTQPPTYPTYPVTIWCGGDSAGSSENRSTI